MEKAEKISVSDLSIGHKWIEGYENLYSVTSMGEIYSYRTKKFLKQEKNHRGYFMVDLYDKYGKKKKYTIHRLVAKAFIPNSNSDLEVDHIDTNRENNNVDNLRWVTAKENCRNPLTLKHSSEARKGEKHYFYGKHHTKETREKCSKSHLGHEVTEETRRKIGLSNKGKVRSDEVKKDISNRMKEWHKTHKSHNMRQVTQCDTNRNVIKVWESLAAASKGTGVSVASILHNIKGRSKSAGGFIWV